MMLANCTVIYGGSFDPPHMSHQMACLYLLEALRAAVVWVIPVFKHPFHKQTTDFAHRFAMCQLLTQPFGERVQVLDVEAQLAGDGRTYDTLMHLQALHPTRQFALAIGADIVAQTPQWYRFDDIVAQVPVVVLGRTGYDAQSSHVLQLPELSSDMIRKRLQQGDSIEGLVPGCVIDYIQNTGLYRRIR